MILGLSVTKSDLHGFRQLLKLFFVELVREKYEEKGSRDDFLVSLVDNVDNFFYLEEPFTCSIVTLDITKSTSGTILVSEDRFNAYKAISCFDLRSHFESVKVVDKESWDKVLNNATRIQERFQEVLSGAKVQEDGATEKFKAHAPSKTKEMLN